MTAGLALETCFDVAQVWQSGTIPLLTYTVMELYLTKTCAMYHSVVYSWPPFKS